MATTTAETGRAGRMEELRLPELLGGLSRALDLADGHALGHARRACWIGMRIADEAGLEEQERFALFYAFLLKDAGCSANAARVAELYRTHEHDAKRAVKLVDYTRPSQALRYIWQNVGGRGPARLANAGRATLLAPRIAREMTEIRCERGADIAAMLSLPDATQEAIRCLDEHWDGRGQPRRLAGEEIPLGARLLLLAQTIEVFAHAEGPERALEVAEERSGTWFDPELVRAARPLGQDERLWAMLADAGAVADLSPIEPATDRTAAGERTLVAVARAFALVVDGKSPFTFRHSVRVAAVAEAIGSRLGLPPDERRQLEAAGLLHDLGKLGVSSRILDKPGALTDDERASIRLHPRLTEEIIGGVPALGRLAAIAGAHHERLDGSGYHRGLRGEELSVAARVLCVADVFEALTAERPYRSPMGHDEALGLIELDRGAGLDADCVDALAAAVAADPGL